MKNPRKQKKTLAFFNPICYYNRAWLHKICVEARGCCLCGREFSPSMSDFKPGGKNTGDCVLQLLGSQREILFFFGSSATDSGSLCWWRMVPVNSNGLCIGEGRWLIGFSLWTHGTPGAVEGIFVRCLGKGTGLLAVQSSPHRVSVLWDRDGQREPAHLGAVNPKI